MRALAAIALALVLAFTVMNVTSLGQGTTGTLRGQVLDPQGATIAKAAVSVTNQATGVTMQAVTTSAGAWSFPSLIPGTYTLTVEAPGFHKFVRKDVPVLADQVNDANTQLQVGATSETVEVTADTAGVQTTSSALSNNYDANEVLNLPNAGSTFHGSPLDLAVLAPNTTAQPGGVTGVGGSVGGTRPRDNNFMVDGVDDNNLGVTGPNSTVIPDAVSEFTLQTNHFSAEYGHSAGGQFNVVTKTGTNNWHGSGYEYFQNRNLNALDNLTQQAIAAGTIPGKPNFDDNRFGGNIGGPLIKNKWFIFGNYEYTTLHGQGTPTSFEAPTAAGLATLQSMAADSAVQNVLKDYPGAPAVTPSLGTYLVNGVNIPIGNLVIISPLGQQEHDAVVNSDYTMGKHQFGARFLFNQENFTFPVNSTQAVFNQMEPVHNRKISLIDTWTANDHLINDLRLQYAFYYFALTNPCTGTGVLSGAPATCPPDVTIVDLGQVTVGPSDVQTNKQNTYTVKDSVSWVHGRHTVKFGGEYSHFIFPQFYLTRSNGDNWYNTMQDLVNDQLPSTPGRTLRNAGSGNFLGTQSFFAGFLQEDLRATRRLTLNLGVRYEYWTNPVGGKTQALNAISSVPGLITFGVPKTDTNNIAPRVGFAYDPFGNGKWSIRGGGGIAYDVKFQNFASITLPPQLQTEFNTRSACSIPSPPAWCTATPNGSGFLAAGGLPVVLVPPTTAAQARNLTTSFIDDTVMPKIISWSLGVQHELYHNSTMEVRYLGTHGLELPVQYRRNHESFFDAGGAPLPTYLNASQIPATFTASTPVDTPYYNFSSLIPAYEAAGFKGNITSDPPLGNSIYHALSVNFVQKNMHGLTLNANYTWAHTIDVATNEFFTSLLNPRRAQDTNQLEQDRANSDLDVRHKFALAGVYQIPNFRTDSGFLKTLLNGYGIGSVYLVQTGQPVTLQSALVDANGNGDTAGDRIFFNPAGSLAVGSDVFPVCESIGGSTSGAPVGSTYIGPTAYTAASFNGCAANPTAPSGFGFDPAIGYTPVNPKARYVIAGGATMPNVGRNSFTSPGFGIWNLSAFKTIRLGEGKSLQFRADAYNVLNQRNYTVSNTNVFSTAGITAATSNPGYVDVLDSNFLNSHVFSSGNRTMTLVVHLYF
ncbi:MAG: TonB-dependent receptor [Acidobacteriaceae bacterium]|nr:TonB-dependent receptor [Acidobacteriaceae bacterium]